MLARFIEHPLARRLLDHPKVDRFDAEAFGAAIRDAGLELQRTEQLWGAVAWFTAAKR